MKSNELYNLAEENLNIHHLKLGVGKHTLLFVCHEGTGKEESITIVLSQEQMNLLREVIE